MTIFDKLQNRDHEQVTFCFDPEVGLRAIIAVHNTVLGPALGGTRMWAYDTDEDALRDVLRLSGAMTYKASIAGLNLGGGKAVIIGDPQKDKSEILFRTFGRFVEGLGGRYITAEDVGTDVRDMEFVRMETKYVTGISEALGGSGDPSPVTAYGVFAGMKACVNELYGNDSLSGKKVAVQGLGHVGRFTCEHLVKDGAKLIVTDIYENRVKPIVKKFNAEYVHPEKIFEVNADIFCPCALGGVVSDESIPKFKFKIIAGGANNQLLDEKKHGQMLLERGILYAPDYAINAGGLINVANELEGYRQDRALMQAEGIYTTLKNIFAIAKRENIPTYLASNKLAEDRIKRIAPIKQIYVSKSEFTGRIGKIDHRRKT